VTEPSVQVIRPVTGWERLRLRELWSYRELLYFLGWRDVKVRYKQTFLGVAWAILQPVLYMVVFTLFFGRLAGLSGSGTPYALLALSGSVIWLYVANSVTLAANSLVGNSALITKVYFPRLLAPVAPVLAGLVDLVLASGVLLVVMAAYGYYVDSPRVLALGPVLLLALLTAIGVGSWLAALNVKYRDVRYVMPFLLQLWLFATPVVYASSVVRSSIRRLYYVNPMAGVLDGFRWAMLGGHTPALSNMVTSTLAALVVFGAGIVYFHRTERRFADVI
jgi:lipopolysaccharide transport system permease protein